MGARDEIRILHVDDQPNVRALLAESLPRESDRMTVTSVEDPERALELLDSASIDCLVTDYKMPGMDGLELLEAVQERHPDVPVVLFTGEDRSELDPDPIEAGAADFVAKRDLTDQFAVLASRILGAVVRSSGADAPDPRDTASADDRKIDRLHRRAARFQACESVGAVYDEMIDAAVDVLEFDWCAVGIVRDGYFELVAVSEAAPVEVGDRNLRADEGRAGRALASGDSSIVEDANSDDVAAPTHESFNSALTVPIGDPGVFQANSSVVEAFDETDLRLAELLVIHAEEALNRVEREEELARQNERLDRFAGVVSHDLRNPLEVAQAELELARQDCDSDHLDRMAVAHDRIEDLIEDALQFARYGQSVEQFDPVDVASLAGKCWATVVTQEADLEVDDAVTVEGDESRLRDLLENLFRNAVEHNDTGDLTVRVGRLDDAGFYVEDDGQGIPEDERDRIFESGYSTAADNTGFGLAIVSEIVQAHGWDLSITDGEAGGARFEIRTRGSRE